MRVISLGWGVQSFTLAAMAALGDIEPVDYAIHADTTHERQATYEFAKRHTGWLEERGVRVVTVKPTSAKIVDDFGGVMIPAHIENAGMFSRQCTDKWKRATMRRWLQANRNGERVEQWLGISLDEFQRMRESDVKYITNIYPLVEKRMTRNDCVNYLQRHGIEVPTKSACVFCPFQRTDEWREVMDNATDFIKATYADEIIREARMPGKLYVHPARIPLGEVDLRTAEEKGQMTLWDNECSGICGV